MLIGFLSVCPCNAYRPLWSVQNLYGSILSGYDTRIRPRINQSESVIVASRFAPNNIIEFETTEQRFSILGTIQMSWIDEVLKWEPSSYYNTQSIKIPLTQIWKPSLILVKAFDGDGIIGDAENDIATVQYDGTVTWSPEGIFSYVCEVDIQFYPFDEQTCTLVYYVSDETERTVTLTHPESVLMDEFIENSEWNLVNVHQTKYKRYDTWFIEVHFTVQRRATFATFTMIVPLLMLAFLNICVFLVPIDSGEKGSFSITIFLSYGIFVSIVSDTLPHNSLQISFFVLFLVVLLLFSVLSVFYTIMQAKLFAAIGEEECKLSICTKFRNKVTPEKKMLPDGEKGVDPGKMNPSRMSVATVSDLELMDEEKNMPIEDEEGEEEKEEEEEGEKFTWRKFLERLDTILFITFFVLIVIATTVFFCLMMQRLGEDSFAG